MKIISKLFYINKPEDVSDDLLIDGYYVDELISHQLLFTIKFKNEERIFKVLRTLFCDKKTINSTDANTTQILVEIDKFGEPIKGQFYLFKSVVKYEYSDDTITKEKYRQTYPTSQVRLKAIV